MRVLITGAKGMLGQELVAAFQKDGDVVLATDREQLDITDPIAVHKFVIDRKPDVVVNAAAYNFVDKVEDPSVYPLALAINVSGPRNLSASAREAGIPFVHYSTDYVFAGDKPEGYCETDQPNPISRYAETKYQGEQAAQDENDKVYILRLSKLFGRPGVGENTKESFVSIMLRLAAEKPELQIVDEEVGSPSYAPDVAATTVKIINSKTPYGIYHLVNDGPGVTWYQFAEEIFAIKGVTTPRKAVSSSQFPPRPAARPKFAALLNTKLPPLRSRIEALKDFLK